MTDHWAEAERFAEGKVVGPARRAESGRAA